jgi:hypothetical protein
MMIIYFEGILLKKMKFCKLLVYNIEILLKELIQSNVKVKEPNRHIVHIMLNSNHNNSPNKK